MKILYINGWIHPKNSNAIRRYINIEFTFCNVNELQNFTLSQFDCVYSPSTAIQVSLYPNTIFIFGPHFDIFNFPVHQINGNRTAYIMLCEWVKNLNSNSVFLNNNIRLYDIPFGVDTDTFNEITPIRERTKVFVYHKRRQPNELHFLEDFLKTNNIEYVFFDYVKKYKEEDYLKCLHDSVFGIWLDAHESQGFALEEALSCNVPLFVWNVKSMNQEHGSNYQNIHATTIPYWDERCGEVFYTADELFDKFQLFISKLDTYKPREYVLENLSIEVCEEKFIQMVNNMKENSTK